MGRPSRTSPSANAPTESWEARPSARRSNLPNAGRREPTITEAPAPASPAVEAPARETRLEGRPRQAAAAQEEDRLPHHLARRHHDHEKRHGRRSRDRQPDEQELGVHERDEAADHRPREGDEEERGGHGRLP